MVAALTSLALAQGVPRLHNETDAAILAAADIRTLPRHDRPFYRYVYVLSGSLEDRQVTSFGVNTVSRSSTVRAPQRLTDFLVRIDLRHYVRSKSGDFNVEDLGDYLTFWEELRFDPTFSLLLTPDMQRFAGVEVVEVKRWFKWKIPGELGHHYEMRPELVKVAAIKAGEVLRVNGALPEAYEALQVECATEAPIVELRYMLTRLLTTIKGQGGDKQIFGGLYYEFAGVVRKPKAGTAEDDFFAKLGVADPEKGVTAAKFYERMESERRAAMTFSNVTAKPRRIDLAPTPRTRDGGWVSITHDPNDDDQDATKDPVKSVLDLVDFAREVRASKPNGFILDALFDKDGALQDEVPFNVAHDHKIPEPHTRRLQPSIGCIRCHGTDGSMGLKPFRNDVADLIRESGILDDLTQRGTLQYAIYKQANDLYGSDPDKFLARARQDYSAAALEATGPWKEGKQADIVKYVSQHVADLFDEYNYRPVDARTALWELRVAKVAENAKAAKMLQEMFPKRPGAPFDPTLGHLQGGRVVTRLQWSLLQGVLAGKVKR